MSDNGDKYSSNTIKLYENNCNATLTTEEDNGGVSEPTLNFLRLISIFENEESDTMSNDLSQKRSTAAAETSSADRRDPSAHVDDVPPEEVAGGPSSRDTKIVATSASGVAVTNRGGDGWTVNRPERHLLVVIHPWCMLRKSDADRQSEFPPPGFLELLKAKLLAIHREANRGQHRQSPADMCRRRRRGGSGQTIKCWFQYTTAAFRGQRAKTVTAANVSYPDGPAVFDFPTIRRRFAAPRDTVRPTDASPAVPPAL